MKKKILLNSINKAEDYINKLEDQLKNIKYEN
jgi:hypothetical protein